MGEPALCLCRTCTTAPKWGKYCNLTFIAKLPHFIRSLFSTLICKCWNYLACCCKWRFLLKKEDRRVQTVTAFPTILQSLLKELEGLADCHPVITCCISRLTLKLGMEDLAEMCKTLFIQKNLPGKLIRKGFPVRFSILPTWREAGNLRRVILFQLKWVGARGLGGWGRGEGRKRELYIFFRNLGPSWVFLEEASTHFCFVWTNFFPSILSKSPGWSTARAWLAREATLD